MRYTRKTRRARSRAQRLALTVLALAALAGCFYYYTHRGVPGAGVEIPEWITQELLPLNPNSRPGTPLEKIDGVVVHYVGNPATSAAANRGYFANLALTNETKASAHFIVGLEGEILQCVPLTEIAYCSNQANSHTVSIEVCHPDSTGEFTPETVESLERLVAWLCVTFRLDADAVIRHYDVTGKICPKFYVENPERWAAFLEDVRLRAAEERKK